MANWYARRFLVMDFVVATLLAIAMNVAVATWWGYETFSLWLQSRYLLMLTASASLAGTFLGFLISAAAVILAFGTMPELRMLRESGKYEQVYIVFFNTMGWLGAVAVIGFGSTVVPADSTWAAAIALFLAWPFFVAVSRVGRCIWILRFICRFAVRRQVEADRVPPVRRAS